MAKYDSLIKMKELEAKREKKSIASDMDKNNKILADEIDKKVDAPENQDADFATTDKVFTEIIGDLGIAVDVEEIKDEETGKIVGKKATVKLEQFEIDELLDRQLGKEEKLTELPAGLYTLPKIQDPETDADTEEQLVYVRGINNLDF